VTRGQLVSRVAAKLGFSTSEEIGFLQAWANEGVVDVLLKTRVYVDIGVATLTSGESLYRGDVNALAIHDVITRGWELRTPAELDAGMRGIAFQGDLIQVSPPPSEDTEILFRYVPEPTPMSADSHDPSDPTYGGIPNEYHRAVEYYMLWQGAEYDDKQAALSPKDYRGAYESECLDIRKRERRKGTRRLSRIPIPGGA
jgi:hypothetical protein